MVDVGAHALPLVLVAAVVVIIVTYGMAWIYVRRKARERVGDECALMVVLGSGGHTAEMLKLVQSFPDAELAETTKEGRRLRGTGTAAKVPPSEITYPRCYVVAQTDSLSASKALRLEGEDVKDRVRVETIPRSREVGQSYLTSSSCEKSAETSAGERTRHLPPAVHCREGAAGAAPRAHPHRLRREHRARDVTEPHGEATTRVQDCR